MAVALGPLARDMRLDPGDRTQLLQRIYALDGLNASLVFKARDLINDIGKLDLPFDPAAIRASRQDCSIASSAIAAGAWRHYHSTPDSTSR